MRELQVERSLYVASDRREFDDVDERRKYEKALDSLKIYMVTRYDEDGIVADKYYFHTDLDMNCMRWLTYVLFGKEFRGYLKKSVIRNYKIDLVSVSGRDKKNFFFTEAGSTVSTMVCYPIIIMDKEVKTSFERVLREVYNG